MKKILSTAVVLLTSFGVVAAIVLASGWNIQTYAETTTAPMYLAQEATPINETIDDSPNPGTYDAGINIYLLVASLCAVGSIWAGIAIFKERKRLYREQNEEILTDVFPEKKA